MFDLHFLFTYFDFDVIKRSRIKFPCSAFGKEGFVILNDSLVWDFVFVKVDFSNVASNLLFNFFLLLSLFFVLILFFLASHKVFLVDAKIRIETERI